MEEAVRVVSLRAQNLDAPFSPRVDAFRHPRHLTVRALQMRRDPLAQTRRDTSPLPKSRTVNQHDPGSEVSRSVSWRTPIVYTQLASIFAQLEPTSAQHTPVSARPKPATAQRLSLSPAQSRRASLQIRVREELLPP